MAQRCVKIGTIPENAKKFMAVKQVDNGNTICSAMAAFNVFLRKNNVDTVVGHNPLNDMKLIKLNAEAQDI